MNIRGTTAHALSDDAIDHLHDWCVLVGCKAVFFLYPNCVGVTQLECLNMYLSLAEQIERAF
ncbi:unannotated protein [freshwater metagenome]|uniref:Unannotated protein n=1 Tax=freshwater metagenome TaxID=449393 RepID=A0A6J7UTL6_9ZZZZ